jgi:hypothetical protein
VNGREVPKGMTFLQAFISPNPKNPKPKGAPFGRAWLVEGEKQGRTIHQGIPDGTSNTIAVVEARDAVIWSKPDDLPFGEKLPPLGAANAVEFFALFLDGHVGAIPTKIDPVTMRSLITVDGGEVVELPGARRPDGGLFPTRPSEPVPPPAKGASGGPPKDKYEELLRKFEADEKVWKKEQARMLKTIEEMEAAREVQRRKFNEWWKDYRSKE